MSNRGMALLAGLIMALMPAAAVAQQGRLRVTLAPTAVAFPTPAMADFDAGWIEHPGITVTITSRPGHADWELRLHAPDPGLGVYGKPLSDLQWRVQGGAWQPLSQLDALVAQGVGDTDLVLEFRMRLDWETDIPGSYGTGLTFSLTRP
ncbi:MAG TPA: hypothetical protein VK966_10065 [Longimicrobiales bacterium]|nr:hypothetical protein [Longimicrobiales bacterium]